MDALVTEITNIALSIARTADPPTVFVIVLVSSLFKYWLWPHWRWPIAYLAPLPFLFSFLVTPAMSLSDEVWWGGHYFWRACLQNGAVSEMVFHMLLPYIHKKYPALFPIMPNNKGKNDNH